MTEKSFFISIGPPKTGTTWIYNNLMQHPEISLPRDKEVRYFWIKERYGDHLKWSELFANHWHFREKRARLRRHLGLYLRGKLPFKDFIWEWNYFFNRKNDQWYLNLFSDQMVSGDLSPKYCELNEDTIRIIRELIPECKIIIGLRDPVERDWSRAKMNIFRSIDTKNGMEDQSAFYAQFNDPDQHASNDYVALIERWKKYFSRQNLFIYYFEELTDQPQLLFDRLCDFLMISRVSISELSKKRNQGQKINIPDDLYKFLVTINLPLIEKMESHYPNVFTKGWASKYANRSI